MRKNYILIILIVLTTLGIAAYIYYKAQYTPKYSWYENYSRTSKEPYGLEMFYSIIKKKSADTKLIYDNAYYTVDTTITNSNFIFAGSEFYTDSSEAYRFIKYAEKGNCVFIASDESPLEVLSFFVPRNKFIKPYAGKNDSIVHVDFREGNVPFKENLKFHYQFLKDTAKYYWSFYKKNYFNDTLSSYNFIPLARFADSSVNAFYITRGKGKIIVQANPILFTNYNIIQENGFKHANNFFSLLNSGTTFYSEPYTGESSNRYSAARNPLKFLFSNSYSKWGWYLFLTTLLLYILFRSKREQRVIPLLPSTKNFSVEFSKAVSTLYYKSKGHSSIASEMYLLFLSEVRQRYSIDTDIPDTELIEQLSLHSGIHQIVLTNLFGQFRYIRSNKDSSNDDLINLYQSIENYHKTRK
jgi:hypothetical protein